MLTLLTFYARVLRTGRDTYATDRPWIVAFGRRTARNMEPARQKRAPKASLYLVGFSGRRRIFCSSTPLNSSIPHSGLAARHLQRGW